MESKEKVIVFGGAGFIGRHVVKELLQKNYEVVIYDKSLPIEDLGCRCIVGDILDVEQVQTAMQGCSIVYNFAGWADLETSINHPVEVVKQNVLGTTILLDAARNSNVKRFVYASSMYVFSKAGSFYRATKQSCELLVEEFHHRFNLDFTILRFGSLYGPGAKHGNTIYELVYQACKNSAINYWGTGDELRQYIHVYDAAKGSVDILSDDYQNQYIILTGSEDIRIKDLLSMINEVFGEALELQFNRKERSDYHYKITPYSFNPRLGKKLVFRTYTDIGQGILQCVQEAYEDIHSESLDIGGDQFNSDSKFIE